MYDKTKVVNLHQHTTYSVLDGLATVSEIVDLAVERGQVAAAITDHGVIDGIIPFYQECKAKGIKPILGEEFYVTPEGRSMFDKDKDLDRARHHLIVLAKNNTGYKNLCKLSSLATIDGFYYKPRIDLETLFKHKEGLIVTSGCYASQLSAYLKEEDYQKAAAYCKKMQAEFGDDFYIEEVWLRSSGKVNPRDEIEGKKSIVERQDIVNKRATALSKKLGIKRVLTLDAHYARKEDQEAHEVLVTIGTGDYLDNPSRLSFIDFWEDIASPDEMIIHANEINDPELLLSQAEIVDKVNLDLDFIGKHHFPAFPTEDGLSEKDYLRRLVMRGVIRRNYYNYNETHTLPKEIIDRLSMELKIIDEMGYNGYHLIVQDYVMWAKTHGVIVGPGRGSAAASVVCYLLGITEVDPMQYDDLMMFQRYLNPKRISMPDIDVDFSDRQVVEDYFKNKWGQENTAAIATTLYMRSKNAFKDVARVMNYPYAESNRIADILPDIVIGRKEKQLKKILESDEDLQREIVNDPRLKKIFNLAERLEGTIRGHGVHACGVVVAPTSLENFMGLSVAKGKEGRIVTQADPADIESIYGLLKMDLLGLSNLTILQEAIEKIKRDKGIDLDVAKIPLDDEATYKTFSNGNSYFTFQYNTGYVRSICKDYKPKNIRDLAWITAVCRPGPMSFIPEMIKIHNGEKKVSYICEAARKIFDPIGGYPVFQESVMKFCMDACGYDESEADAIRKAMAKSKPAELAKHKERFIQGYLKHTNPHQKREIESFWKDLEGFSRYAFNFPHALCYAHIGYWTCYFLTHYPEYYLSAYMNSKADDKKVLAEVMTYCKKVGIKIKAPDVNYSTRNFQPDDTHKTIYYGLSMIKGIGVSAEEIIKNRKENGLYKSIEDLIDRIPRKTLNSGKLKALIYGGGLDSIVKGKRGILHHNIDKIVGYRNDVLKITEKRQKAQAKVNENQLSLFDELFLTEDELLNKRQLKQKQGMILPSLVLDEIPYSKDPAERERQRKSLSTHLLFQEKAYLGDYVTRNPLELYGRNEQWCNQIDIQIEEQKDLEKSQRQKVTVTGLTAVVQAVKIVRTKSNNEPMAILKLDAYESEVKVVIFPTTYKTVKGKLAEGQIILISGNYMEGDRESGYQISANSVRIIRDANENLS